MEIINQLGIAPIIIAFVAFIVLAAIIVQKDPEEDEEDLLDAECMTALEREFAEMDETKL